jgi:hypothetical protein
MRSHRRSGHIPSWGSPVLYAHSASLPQGQSRPPGYDRRFEPSNFCATGLRNQPRRVSGFATWATFARTFRPSRFLVSAEWQVPHSKAAAGLARAPSGFGSRWQSTRAEAIIPDSPVRHVVVSEGSNAHQLRPPPDRSNSTGRPNGGVAGPHRLFQMHRGGTDQLITQSLVWALGMIMRNETATRRP